MKLKLNKEGTKKFLSKLVLGVATIAVVASPIKAFAHDAYFLGITFDKGSKKYMGTIAYDDNTLKANNHNEANIAGFYDDKILDNTFTLPKVDMTTIGDDAKSNYPDVKGGDGDKAMIYTFPSIHTRTIVGGCETDASASDMERVNWVNETLITSFNEALLFVQQATGQEYKEEDVLNLAVDLANAGQTAMSSGSATFTSKNKTYQITKGYDKPIQGLLSDCYIKIAVDGVTQPFVFKVPKGYYDTNENINPMNSTLPEKYRNVSEDKSDIEYLSWKHVVLQGNYNYQVKGITYSKITEITKPSKFTQLVNDMLSSTVNGLRSLLGLFSLQELMLNQGSRSNTYFHGIMPTSWYQSAQSLHWVCQCMAWLLIIGAIVKILFQRNLATINTSMRINLIENIQNLLLSGVLLSVIIPAFIALATLNEKIVTTFGLSSIYIDEFGSISGTSSGLIGGTIISIVYLIIIIYFNFVYLMRGITISLLYATAPLFVCAIAFNGKYKQLFGNFMKELISYLFLQSIHALCLSFFATTMVGGGSSRLIESLVVLFAFIPLTQFLKKNVMGLSGADGDKLSSGALMTGALLTANAIRGTSSRSKSENKHDSETGNSKENNFQNKSEKISENSQLKSRPTTTTYDSGSDSGLVKPLSGDVNDEVPQVKLTDYGSKLQSKQEKANNYNSEMVKNLGKNALKGAGSVGAMAVGAGLAIGGASTGAHALGFAGGALATKGVQGLGDVAGSIGNDIMEHPGMSKFKKETHLPSDEGYMYHEQLDDGSLNFKYDTNTMCDTTGIADMYDTKDGIQYELDGNYDSSTGEFSFANDELNQIPQKANLNEMVRAFATKDEDAIKYYNKQGIRDVGVKDNGNIVISTKKGYNGVNKVAKSGDNYIVNRNNTASPRLMSTYNIPSYSEAKKNSEATQNA